MACFLLHFADKKLFQTATAMFYVSEPHDGLISLLSPFSFFNKFNISIQCFMFKTSNNAFVTG